MANIKYEKRQQIINQALNEIRFARTYKQGKTKNWKINEDLYYGRKIQPKTSRANVDLGQMASFVHTLLSKIDNPLQFKFAKRKKSQMSRVELLNSLRAYDQDRNDWNIKDIVGKKQAIIYGRAIYCYYADSYNGYEPHLEPVDVYDFLIDPAVNGYDIESADYMGRYGVVLNKSQIKEGIRRGEFLRTEGNMLLEGAGNITEQPQEEANKLNRTQDQNVWTTQKEISNPDKYKFWQWYTTYEGTRYRLLLTERGATALVVEPLKESFASNMWPFWTWAAFPDMTEFWTPSFCDYVRDIMMAQAVSINQMLDNAEQINKPQRIIEVGAIENLAELKYRPEGYIKVKSGGDINKSFQVVSTPNIDTPLKVFGQLDALKDKTSGVTAGVQGVADEEKVGIYEGNQANAADRFGYLNKSYSFGYKRFAKLYECGVKEHLIKRIAVDILGPDGVEVKMVNYRDIYKKNDEYGLIVEASNAELQLSETDKRTKLAFLAGQTANPMQNPKKAYEIQAGIAGFNDDEVRELMDTDNYGTAKAMSEAERDIESLLENEKISPNTIANTAYMQKFIDYMNDHKEDITQEQFLRLTEYVSKLQPIIVKNMARQAQNIALQQQMAGLTNPQQPTEPPSPTNQVIEQEGLAQEATTETLQPSQQ